MRKIKDVWKCLYNTCYNIFPLGSGKALGLSLYTSLYNKLIYFSIDEYNFYINWKLERYKNRWKFIYKTGYINHLCNKVNWKINCTLNSDSYSSLVTIRYNYFQTLVKTSKEVAHNIRCEKFGRVHINQKSVISLLAFINS